MGATADSDKVNAFEICRIYIAVEAQGKGIGGQLLAFAEQKLHQEKSSKHVVRWVLTEKAEKWDRICAERISESLQPLAWQKEPGNYFYR